MKALLEILSAIRRNIGGKALSFFLLSFLVLGFSQKITGSDTPSIDEFMQLTAGMLFFIGLIVALFPICSEYFRSRAGRSLTDGLFAGMLSGLIGGMFGFGWHQDGYLENQLYRCLLCIMFATPVGGLAGLSLFILHPKIHIQWRKHLSGTL